MARAVRERRLAAMGRAVAAYEAEHGEISTEELAAQRRDDRRAAIVVSPELPRATSSNRRRAP